MPRTIIDIPDALQREVDRLCQLIGISRAEAVRRGLQEFVQQNEAVKTDGFGLWRSAEAAKPAAAGAAAGRTRRSR